ncbi:MAG: hypothetical protein ABIJ65_10130, partial [Chloroflexota bacterium]
MLPEQLRNFREIVTIADGTRILLRPMTQGDQILLSELYSSIKDEDLRYFRHNVKDPNILKGWIEKLDYNQTI